MSEKKSELEMATEVDFKDLIPKVVWELSDYARLDWKEDVKSWFRRLGDDDKRKLVRLLQVRKRERDRLVGERR